MKLPGYKSPYAQLPLWEPTLGNHGHCRTILGDFAEHLTALLFHGKRFRTDSTADYCPDIIAYDAYFEVKAVGRNNYSFIYEGRLHADHRFAEEYPLFYVLWHHATNTAHARSHRELRSLFLATLRSIFVVPFTHIYEVALSQPLKKLNSKYGNSDTVPTYGAGRIIPIHKLLTVPHLQIAIEQVPSDLFD